MEKVVVFLSTERHNPLLLQELQSAAKILSDNTKKKCNPSVRPSVRLAALSARGGDGAPPTTTPQDTPLLLWLDWAAPDPLQAFRRELPLKEEEEEEEEGKKKEEEEEEEEKDLFRYNDFFLLGEALHKLLDDLGDPGGAALFTLIWCVQAYAPSPSEVPEFFGALQRFHQWHFGSIHLTSGDKTLVEEWKEYLPLQILQSSAEAVLGVISCFWRGHLALWEEGTGEVVQLPLCEVGCVQGQPHPATLPRQAPFYFLPVAEVVADFDSGTMPWVYLQGGGVYSLHPAPPLDPQDQEEVEAALSLFTAQPGTVTLVRLQFSPLPPVLDNLKELSTEEWKRANVEGHFDLVPSLQFKGFHTCLNMLILSEGASKGKAWMVALKNPENIGEDVLRIINTSTHTKSSHSPQEADKVLELLKETPCFTPVHMSAFSHLCLNLPNQIQERLAAAGHKAAALEASVQQEVEAAVSQEVLTTLLERPAPPPLLSSHLVTVPPETAISTSHWPEYIALERAEMEAEKHARRSSGDLLGGLAPPPPSKAILTLEASQLVKLFAKTGQPSDVTQRKMSKHKSLGRLPFKFTSSLEDVKVLAWPEALYAHHHGIHYNVGEQSERFVEQCCQAERRYIRQEVASTCTLFQDRDSVYMTVPAHCSRKEAAKEPSEPSRKSHNLRRVEARRGTRGLGAGKVLGSKVVPRGRGGRAEPVRRSPRKRQQLLIPESALRRSPRRAAVKTSPAGSLADLMKPSVPQKAAHGRGSKHDKKTPKPADLSDIHKQKLRVAVVDALEREGVCIKDPLFKVCFKKLFAVCRPFALDVIGQGSTSKNMERIATAHVKQVIDFERRRAVKTKR